MVRFFGRRDWIWAVLLIVLVVAAYARVFDAGFIWDDESHLTRNPCIVGPLGLKEIWTSTRAVYYPLVLTTFWALHKFVGLVPLPYHPRGIGDITMVRSPETRGPRRMVGRGSMGVAPRDGAISRLGD